MEHIISKINGTEDITKIQSEELQAVVQFYKAFNERNLTLMQNVWLNTEEASMNNPVGGIMRGWQNIASVYSKIFTGEATVFVEFYDFTLHATDTMFFITGRERGFFQKGNVKVDLAIRTSRVFIKQHNEWKQIQHHGSIDNPELLKTYQYAIVGR